LACGIYCLSAWIVATDPGMKAGFMISTESSLSARKDFLLGRTSYAGVMRSLEPEVATLLSLSRKYGPSIFVFNQWEEANSIPSARFQQFTYVSFVDRYYQFAFGPADAAARLLRSRGVRYFYIDPRRPLLAPLFAPIFHPDSIEKNFKTVPGDFPGWLLTWKSGPQDSVDARFMAIYREIRSSAQSGRYAKGREYFLEHFDSLVPGWLKEEQL
jgi:hypothetical protein